MFRFKFDLFLCRNWLLEAAYWWYWIKVEVVNFGDAAKSNEANDDSNGIVQGAKEDDAAEFSHETSEELKEANHES